MNTDPANDILRRYWGHEALRPAQQKAIGAVMEGRDTLAILPTGGGKSVCYQIPALLLPGVTLVVSPLIALMEDQVKALTKKGIPAAYINSTLPYPEIQSRLDQASVGNIRILYITPERIATENFEQAARYMNVSLIAVDEAHCISEWGHDFRPAYRNIAGLRKLFSAPVIALTATATRKTATDICQSLSFRADFEIVLESLRRANLTYRATESNSCTEDLLNILRQDTGTAIVYCGTRAEVLATAHLLEKNGISATQYHAGLAAAVRSRALSQWMGGEKRVMVATNAFGMGIDKADVRTIVHRYIPPSPEDYFQQAGRVGRDGLPGKAIVLYDRKAVSTMKRLSGNTPDARHVLAVYRSLCVFLHIGEGELPEGDALFPPDDFYRFCGKDPAEVRTALAVLVRSGIIRFSDSENPLPRVRVLATPAECHNIPDGNTARAMEALARSLDGVFSYASDLDPELLADQASLTIKDFEKALEDLSKWGMIEYRPAKKYSSLFLCTPRNDSAVKALLEKSSADTAIRRKERAGKMEEYLRTDQCRARWLEAYFGENRTEDCQMCDNCLKNGKGSSVEKILGSRRLSAQAIAQETGQSLEEVIASLRILMEEGRAVFDGRGKFYLKSDRPQ